MVLNLPVLSSTNLLSAWTPHSQTQQWAVYPSNHQHKWTLPPDSHRGRCRDLQVLQPRKLHKGGGVQIHSCLLECRLSSSTLSQGMPPVGCHWQMSSSELIHPYDAQDLRES